MKKISLMAALSACSLVGFAQDFPGIRSSNYSGVSGAFYNPANLADNRYKASINLFSLNASLGNDQLSYRLNALSESFDSDKMENRFFGASAGRTNALLTLSIHGPSVSFTAGPKLGFALTSRARVFGTIQNFEGKLFGSAEESDNAIDPSFPYTFAKGADMKVAAHVFSEIGFSSGFVLMNNDEHFLKAGVGLKYLVGVGNAYYNFQNLSGTIDQQNDDRGPYLTNAQGRVAVGMGGINIDAADYGDLLKRESRGFGGDIGFVYEYRPDYAKYNKYKFKFGVALTDIGRISYTRDPQMSADYSVRVAANQRLYLDDVAAGEDESITDYFDAHPEFFTKTPGSESSTYKVNLPTTLNLDLDYQVSNNVYINLNTQLPVGGKSAEPYNNKLYTSLSVTPRFETKAFGVYLPVHYNALTKLNAGLSLRLGPIFVGSGSVITALVGNSKQADVHAGIRFGVFRKSAGKPAATTTN